MLLSSLISVSVSGNWVLDPSLMTHVTPSKLLTLSEPQFPHLGKRDANTFAESLL